MTEPRWMTKARTHLGTKEVPGTKSNPKIMGWAARLGGWIKSFYKDDSIPWCGLFVGFVMAECGFSDLPKNPLGALQWNKFGKALGKGVPGAILTFSRQGGGHVGFYVGEDKTHYHVLGGNQSDNVTITRIAKNRLSAIRWPAKEAVTGSTVWLSSTGTSISKNEA